MSRRVLNIAWVAVVAVAGFVGFRYFTQQQVNEPFTGCVTGFIEPTSSWSELGVDEWQGEPLALDAVVDVPLALSATLLGDDLLVAAKDGQVLSVAADGSSRLLWEEPGITTEGDESGLLDVAFDEDREVVYTSVTRSDGALEVRSRPMGDLLGSYDVVISVDQPHEWHNGGDVELGPDGFVYLSLGDGGPNSDPDGNGQNLGTLLGSILRIDPTGSGYEIPADNPISTDGSPIEQVAYGLRNAWRISFDRETGLLWLADVGNFCVEEVNVLELGQDAPVNFGWAALEGSARGREPVPEDHVPPLFEYGRSEGCSIIGGYVYRGEAIPELRGMYLFSDFCQGRILALESDGRSVDRLIDLGLSLDAVASFAEDADGELLVLSQASGVHRLVPQG